MEKFLLLTNVFAIDKCNQRMAKTQDTKNGGYLVLHWQVFWTQLNAASKFSSDSGSSSIYKPHGLKLQDVENLLKRRKSN